jgi:hypothetical protein
MFIRILVVVPTSSAVANPLLPRRALGDSGSPRSLSGRVSFIPGTAQSPWVFDSLTLQALAGVVPHATPGQV